LIQGLKEMICDLIDIKFGDQTPDAQHLRQLLQDMNHIETIKAFKEKIKAGASITELKDFSRVS
jgi:hypothetical protein